MLGPGVLIVTKSNLTIREELKQRKVGKRLTERRNMSDTAMSKSSIFFEQ